MTSPEEITARMKSEERAIKFRFEILVGLEAALGYHQIYLHGYSVKITPSYNLLTIRATRADVQQVAFVGAETIDRAFIKAATLARQDKLSWQADKYVSDEV